MGDMDDNSLPNDLAECQALLMAAFKQSLELEQQVADAKRDASQVEQRVAESEKEAAELRRVLDETAASYETLQQEHAVTLEELAWYKRWAFGRRRERYTEAEGQGHFKLVAHIHSRPKYACRRCKNGVSAAPLPARPIPGGIAGPGRITEKGYFWTYIGDEQHSYSV
jgi:hypothetical protein